MRVRVRVDNVATLFMIPITPKFSVQKEGGDAMHQHGLRIKLIHTHTTYAHAHTYAHAQHARTHNI